MKFLNINKCLLLSLFFFVISNSHAANHENQIHVIKPGDINYLPVHKDKMWQNIKEAAIKYQQYAPLPRVAFFDITYPKDKKEYEELGGHGVLLVTAISQLKEELPIKDVYVTTQNSKVKLEKIGFKISFIPEKPKVVIATVGKYREDSIYLFPMYLRAQSGHLTIDFSKNRAGFILSEFPYEQDELPIKQPAKKGPSKEALNKIIKREIPIFEDLKL